MPRRRWTVAIRPAGLQTDHDPMAIILPEGLASTELLRGEGIEVLHRPTERAMLRIGLINLMPDIVATERQFGRLLGAIPVDLELVLALPTSYRSGHEGTERYERWGEMSSPKALDGLIVTGAPLEHLRYEDV